MPGHDRAPTAEGPSASQLFNLCFVAIAGHSCCIWPFMRRRFGIDALFPAGPAAAVLMFFYAGFGECPEMFNFFLLWFVAVLYHRARSVAAHAFGRPGHSKDDGDPWLAGLLWPFGRPGDFFAKFVIEPLIAVTAGGAVFLAYSEPLGRFLMAAAASQVFKKGVERAVQNARLKAWRDKDIEMRALAERLRGGR